ncbi:hypothetical protein D3C84_1094390 [compost metagenome]
MTYFTRMLQHQHTGAAIEGRDQGAKAMGLWAQTALALDSGHRVLLGGQSVPQQPRKKLDQAGVSCALSKSRKV